MLPSPFEPIICLVSYYPNLDQAPAEQDGGNPHHNQGDSAKNEGEINPTKSSILRGPHSAGGVLTPPLAKGVLRPLGTPASASPQQAAGHRI
jgi:hypothetical protein